MKFHELSLAGAFLIEGEPLADERGFFARVFCREAAAAHGIIANFVQRGMAYNGRAGTLRGLHFQIPPKAEAKLVRCTRGSLFDVIVDLRSASPTYRQWTSVQLDSAKQQILYIPEGFAHGYQTLEERTEVEYDMSAPYDPQLARGLRWDDPAFAIRWPEAVRTISARDREWPLTDIARA